MQSRIKPSEHSVHPIFEDRFLLCGQIALQEMEKVYAIVQRCKNRMKALGISYKNAPVAVREKFSFDAEKRAALRSAIGHAAVLCTCNRTELYFTDKAVDAAALLVKYSGFEQIPEYLHTYEGEGALRHLFRVSSGIDSMLIGEDEILRQVKEAYAEASDAGTTDFELNTAFQAAITCAKRIKTETALSKTPVSAATIAANEAAKLGDDVNILMIGASGKIGSSTLKNLLPRANVRITQTARAHSAGTVQYEGVTTVPYDKRYVFADSADCIISATASPHFTLTKERLKAALQTSKPRLLIDLAVPPDIERGAAELDGVRLIGIDDLGELARQNNELKMSAAEQAELIINEEIDELRKKLAFHAFLPRLDEARAAAGRLSFDELLYKLRDGLTAEQFTAVLKILGETET